MGREELNPIPGTVIATQSFGDFLGFNPHCHILVTDGCFYGKAKSTISNGTTHFNFEPIGAYLCNSDKAHFNQIIKSKVRMNGMNLIQSVRRTEKSLILKVKRCNKVNEYKRLSVSGLYRDI